MIKKCAKCKVDFECNTENIAACHCNTVVISDKTLELLKIKYANCLCSACLWAIANEEE